FDDQHALLAVFLVRDQSGDELMATGAVKGDERRGVDGLHLESVLAGGQCGVLPANFVRKREAALKGALGSGGGRACENSRQRECCDNQHAIPKRCHKSSLRNLSRLRPLL